jgi:(p)ppGpp synthase/HD superfamily hydrolase
VGKWCAPSCLTTSRPRGCPAKHRREGKDDPRLAQQIACTSHVGQRTRFGDPVIKHIERVADAVAPEAQAVAWLHDLFELTPVGREPLRACGLTTVEELILARRGIRQLPALAG